MLESKVTLRSLYDETLGIGTPSRVYMIGGPSVCSAAHLPPAKAIALHRSQLITEEPVFDAQGPESRGKVEHVNSEAKRADAGALHYARSARYGR